METKKANKLIYLFLIIASIVTFFACEKGPSGNPMLTDNAVISRENLSNIQQHLITSSSFNEASQDADLASFKNGIWFGWKSSCATESIDSSIAGQKTYTITYDSTCNKFGRIKSGDIVIVVKGVQGQAGYSRSVTYNLTINGRKIEGTQVDSYLGLVNNQEQWESKLTGGKVTFFKDTTYMTHEYDFLKTLTSGSFANGNAIYTITDNNGTPAMGRDRKGVTFSTIITEPLNFKQDCRFPVSGTIETTVTQTNGTSKTDTVTYSNSNCEGKAFIRCGRKEMRIKIND
jgi:hypothetical protein